VASRLGSIGRVRTFRANITTVAANSARAKQAWMNDKSIDVWLLWTI